MISESNDITARYAAEVVAGCVVLVAGEARATLCLRGAELRDWSVGGRAILWHGKPEIWDGVAPVLFPVCGALRGDLVRYPDRTARMPMHGFAQHWDFVLAGRGDDWVELVLRDDADSRAIYPYSFTLTLRYRLEEAGLTQELSVETDGPVPLPYALGVHPGFAVPGGQALLRFEREETPDIPVVIDRMFTGHRRPSGLSGRRLRLGAESFSAGGLCFLDAKSRALRLERPDGHGVEMQLEGFPHLVIWGRPGADLVALEGWTGFGDAVGWEGEFERRPSMRLLEPGQEDRYRVALSVF